MTSILITGASGFLGLPCVQAAAATGARVMATSRSRPAALGDATFHPVDLFSADEVATLMRALRPTHLVHLAWIATPGTYRTSPENHRWVDASRRLLEEFVRQGGQRAVLVGSCAEYAWDESGLCNEEVTPLRPASLYGQCKERLRREAEEIARRSGVSLAWVRLFFLYGPREPEARLVPTVARKLIAGLPAECTAGTQMRDLLHVRDAAEAIVAVLASDLTGAVNVGSGEAVAVGDVARLIADAAGRPDLLRLGVLPLSPDEPATLVADVGRLRRGTGWAPRIALPRGLGETVSWWRDLVATTE